MSQRYAALILFFVVSLSGVAVAGISETEPNGTLASATTVALDASNRGAVSVAKINPRTELDLYRVTIPVLPGPLTLRTVMTPTAADGALDAWIRILSSTGESLVGKDGSFDNGQEVTELMVVGGSTYYIECRSADSFSSGTGDYRLEISVVVPPTILSAYWDTPNGTLRCFDATRVSLNAKLAGFAVGDVVTFSVFEEDNLTPDDPIGTANVTVFSAGSALYASASWDAKWISDESGDPEFYFTVTGRGATATSPLLDVLPGDPDDQQTEATPLGPLTTTQEKTDEVILPDDVDLYSLQVSAGQRLTFDVDRPAGALAPTLRLFASNGSELVRNTGGAAPLEAPANEAFIERTFPLAGTIYVGISGAGNTNYDPITGAGDLPGSTGSYRLTVSPGIAGHVQKPGSSTEYLVDLLRADKPGAPVDSLQTTWVVVHGWNSSRTEPNIAEVATALAMARPNDQVVTLDWSSISRSGVCCPGAAAGGIIPVATWAANALQNAGFFGHQLNLVGHSFGSYVVDEIAKRYPGKVNSIVALDPAANVAPGAFDPVTNNEVDFMRDSRWSWAFHSSSLGNEYTPARAHEAFIVDSGLNALSAHGAVVDLFAYMIMHPNDPSSALFGLDDLLDMAYGPWVLDQYASFFAADAPVFGYEAIITDPDGKTPTRLNYLVNAPGLWIDSPSPNAVVKQSPVVFKGRASDSGSGNSGIVSVLVNGRRATGDTAGSTNTANWTATLPLKLGTNLITVVATDGSLPNVGSTTNRFTVAYDPAVILMPDVTVDEGDSLTVNLAANDGELSVNPLTYVFGIGPTGMTVSASGTLNWTPAEAQGPSTNLVEVGVTDGSIDTRKRFTVIVREVNSAPSVKPVAAQTLADGVNLSLDLNATDSDIPVQALTFALIDRPDGALVDRTGRVTWNPLPSQRPGNFRIRFSVSDGVASVTNEIPVVLLAGGSSESSSIVTVQTTDQDNHILLRVRAETGAVLLLESAETIGVWTEERRVTGRGRDAPVGVELILEPSARSKFWRVRPSQ